MNINTALPISFASHQSSLFQKSFSLFHDVVHEVIWYVGQFAPKYNINPIVLVVVEGDKVNACEVMIKIQPPQCVKFSIVEHVKYIKHKIPTGIYSRHFMVIKVCEHGSVSSMNHGCAVQRQFFTLEAFK
jgi:hypothetical protein